MNCVAAGRSSSSSSTAGCAPSLDTNVTIQTPYNADGNVSSITAITPLTNNLVTQYIYGTTLSDSAIASALLKRYEILPDSTGGSDQVAFAYNRQGQRTSLSNQNVPVAGTSVGPYNRGWPQCGCGGARASCQCPAVPRAIARRSVKSRGGQLGASTRE